jgi:hypothetical protein
VNVYILVALGDEDFVATDLQPSKRAVENLAQETPDGRSRDTFLVPDVTWLAHAPSSGKSLHFCLMKARTTTRSGANGDSPTDSWRSSQVADHRFNV